MLFENLLKASCGDYGRGFWFVCLFGSFGFFLGGVLSLSKRMIIFGIILFEFV